jgi:hypothetical protein
MFLIHQNYRANIETYLRSQGFNERTISNSDTEATNYDVPVSTVKTSDGFYPTSYVFFRWKVPASLRMRVLNRSILRMKLQNSSGTELPNDALIFIGIHRPGERKITFFAELIYSPWKTLSLGDQRDITKNEGVAIAFLEPQGAQIPFVEFSPDDSLVFAVSGTSVLISKSHANHIVEIDVGIKNVS